MSWKTVPNFFPDYDDFSREEKYRLAEGYGIEEWETKRSGRYYKKVRMSYHNQRISGYFEKLLGKLGFERWWKKWQPNKSIWGRICGSWKLVEKTKEL